MNKLNELEIIEYRPGEMPTNRYYNSDNFIRQPVTLIQQHLNDPTMFWELHDSTLENKKFNYSIDISDDLKDIKLYYPTRVEFSHAERNHLRPYLRSVIEGLFMKMVSTPAVPKEEEPIEKPKKTARQE